MSCELTIVCPGFEFVQQVSEGFYRPDTVESHKMQSRMPKWQVKCPDDNLPFPRSILFGTLGVQ